jgi:hypothetical protein
LIALFGRHRERREPLLLVATETVPGYDVVEALGFGCGAAAGDGGNAFASGDVPVETSAG